MTLTQLKYAIAVAQEESMHKAAERLYISQPSLSAAIKSVENEIGFDIFIRSNKKISLSTQGEEFIGYAKQVIEQYQLMEDKYVVKECTKRHKFSVSTQHYTFAIAAFVKLLKEYQSDEYEFELHETQAGAIIDNVKNFKSEIGILYTSDFNREVLTSVFQKANLEFHEIIRRSTFVYLHNSHPLAMKGSVTLDDLQDYPCLLYSQGTNQSFYFSEDILSTHHYKKVIKVTDRATAMDLMAEVNGYIIGTGILHGARNTSEYCSIPLKPNDVMVIGYITIKNLPLSKMGTKYITEIRNAIKPEACSRDS